MRRTSRTVELLEYSPTSSYCGGVLEDAPYFSYGGIVGVLTHFFLLWWRTRRCAVLLVHRRRRKLQKNYHSDILNSQYTYYGAGLLSSYDPFPEHQAFVQHQYGY
ncbi:hypothetical protein Tcan_05029 [Toxocara canis]|uniref:Uncharacterized protein n=1 Tax=Toxocara canis TaxID=6265 RepID=A0A0B2V8F7_TOXCA|nr:hypothetical protein Tcan_05029 [Toxocara canis]